MSQLEELRSRFAAFKERVNELKAQTGAAQIDTEELADRLGNIGTEGSADTLRNAAGRFEGGRVTLTTLDTMVDSALELIDQAMNQQGGSSKSPTGDIPFSVTVQEKSDPNLFTSPGSFEKENQEADDDGDKSKVRRLGRKFVRNTGNLQKSLKDQAGSIAGQQDGVDPWGPDARTETSTPQTPTATNPPQADVKIVDAVGSLFVAGAVAFEAATRFMPKRKKDGNGTQ
ncbi:hypothetical protein [Salininema proteolyticum]|uniref:Uncharacterized protein n=1 Tax=Salininema proteolyticum TaxID=1607685 RepID=A0ABV8TZM3_9ACTN